MRPVFIGGCDRSGTTFLGSMLGAHADCLTVPESQFIINSLAKSYLADSGRIDTAAAFEAIRTDPRFGIWDIDLGQFHDWLENSANSYPALIEWIVQQYGGLNGNPSPDLWIDHTPWNVRYVQTLANLFPEARFIHIVRDGRAVAASILNWESGPRTIDKAAFFWLRNLSFGLAAESYLDSGRIVRVSYESLVLEPEVTLKQICSFLQIEYQSEMVKGTGFKVPDFTQKNHALVGQEPDTKRVNDWTEALSSREIEIFESITGDMLLYLGYIPKFGAEKRPMTTRESAVSHLKNYQMFASNFRQRFRLLASARKANKAHTRDGGY